MIKSVSKILARCGTDCAVLPPTELYNEGWMLRLLLDWFDRNRKIKHKLSFAADASWYSEALLASRFLPTKRGDKRAESFTHADGIIGHFEIKHGKRGDARLSPKAKQFLVIEAKLGSALSAGTKNAPTYDQAARNVACIACVVSLADIDPSALDQVGFYVIAPKSQIQADVFSNLVSRENIERKVRERLASYSGEHDNWFKNTVMPLLERIDLAVMSWEDILDALPSTPETVDIRQFYTECLKWNLLRGSKVTEFHGTELPYKNK